MRLIVWIVTVKHPYPLPAHLPPDLLRVHAYWEGLLRGGAEMPFWDDAKLTDLPDLADRLFLIDVFQRPQRFRLNTVGKALTEQAIEGEFLDEVDLGAPFDFLLSQCSATVEAARPSHFGPATPPAPLPAYSRLLLPMWGDGRVGMILGVVDFT